MYPYEWTESVSQLLEAKELPEKEAFYSSLSEQHISDEDYEHRILSEDLILSYETKATARMARLYAVGYGIVYYQVSQVLDEKVTFTFL